MSLPFPILTAAEAAAFIKHGDVLGLNAFTAAGAAKAIARAIAARAREEHTAGRPFKVGMITGASTGPSLDGELAKADAVSFRTPFQSDADMRKAINQAFGNASLAGRDELIADDIERREAKKSRIGF